VVRHHLLGCTRCAVELGRIRAVGEVLRSAPPVPGPPEALVDRLLALPADALHVLPQPRHREGVRERAPVGAAGLLVAAVVMLGTVGAGAVVTGVPVPWPTGVGRASVSTVLPRLWSQDASPGGAVSVRPVDNGSRP